MAPEREWFASRFEKPTCSAVTGRHGRTEVGVALDDLDHDCRLGDIVIFIRPDARDRTWIVEAMRAINLRRQVKMSSAAVYALADQGCP